MVSIHRFHHLALRLGCLACICCGLLLSACAINAQGTYKPPFVPVEFVIDTQGNISIQASSASLTTPIGDFGVGLEAEQNLTAPNGGLLVVIQRLLNGEPMDAAFKINEDNPDKLLVIDDDISIHFTGQLRTINAKKHHTILLTTPQAQSTGTIGVSYCTLPPIDASASKIFADVRHTSALTDWQTGTLAPQNDQNTFALKEVFITAALMRTNSAGTATIKTIYCSDGHDTPNEDLTEQVPGNLAGTWYSLAGSFYDTDSPHEVGPIMQVILWNGKVVNVSFLNIETTDVVYACPAPRISQVSGFSLSNLGLDSSRVTQRDTSNVSFDYSASRSGTLETYICIDGTTWQVATHQLASGSSNFSDGAYMIADPSRTSQCLHCEWYGAARWIIVWNAHVVGQIPFTVTE